MQNMKKKRLLGLLSVPLALALALSLGAVALAQPLEKPHQFWGTVIMEGETVGAGVTVSAEIDGFEYESGVTNAQGIYGWDPEDPFSIPSDDPGTPEKDGGVNGDEVVFKLNGVEATETVIQGLSTFKSGGGSEINLSIGAVVLLADAGGPYFGTVGASIALSGSASGGTPDYTYAWDLDNDGQYDDADGENPSYSWETADTYTIGLQVTDSALGIDTDTATVTVTEVDAFDPWIYDNDPEDGVISKDEALAAVVAYEADDIEKDDVLAVVILYFSY